MWHAKLEDVNSNVILTPNGKVKAIGSKFIAKFNDAPKMSK
jgi:hypothetical protein